MIIALLTRGEAHNTSVIAEKYETNREDGVAVRTHDLGLYVPHGHLLEIGECEILRAFVLWLKSHLFLGAPIPAARSRTDDVTNSIPFLLAADIEGRMNRLSIQEYTPSLTFTCGFQKVVKFAPLQFLHVQWLILPRGSFLAVLTK